MVQLITNQKAVLKMRTGAYFSSNLIDKNGNICRISCKSHSKRQSGGLSNELGNQVLQLDMNGLSTYKLENREKQTKLSSRATTGEAKRFDRVGGRCSARSRRFSKSQVVVRSKIEVVFLFSRKSNKLAGKKLLTNSKVQLPSLLFRSLRVKWAAATLW
jgi:hypothetical protein